MSGSYSGVQYGARKVIAAHQSGSGAVLTLSTDDPSGRTLQVAIEPDGAGLIRVAVTPDPAIGVAMMSDSFASSASEAFYGFGGRHNALNQHGQAFSSWVEEENIPGLAAPGTPAGILYPNGPTAAFDVQAQFISSRGYGFLLDQPQLSWFRLDSDRPDAWSVATAAPSLTYVVAPGTPTQAIGNLTARTGRQPAPPLWALGPMMDRLVKNKVETLADYQANLNADITNIDRYHMPLTGYRIEGWRMKNPDNDGIVLYNPPVLSFATQTKIINELEARHIHPLAYLRPFIAPGSYPDRKGYSVKNAQGKTYITTGTLSQTIGLIDFTNPAAVRWWEQQVADVLNLGFDGFMADFGEEVVAGMHFHNGQTGATMHNLYPVLYMKATREAVDAYERSHPNRQIWFYNRAGYSGTPGSAAYEGGNVPGDEATYRGAGLRHRLTRARHAEPRDRRRLRVLDRHRRLLRLHHATHDQAAVPALGRVGGAESDLPPARRRAHRHAHSLVLRPADSARLQPAVAAARAGRSADPETVEVCRPDRHSTHPSAVARVPQRPARCGARAGVDPRGRRTGRAGRDRGGDQPQRLLPPRLLARATDRPYREWSAFGGRERTPDAAPVLLPLRYLTIPRQMNWRAQWRRPIPRREVRPVQHPRLARSGPRPESAAARPARRPIPGAKDLCDKGWDLRRPGTVRSTIPTGRASATALDRGTGAASRRCFAVRSAICRGGCIGDRHRRERPRHRATGEAAESARRRGRVDAGSS